MLGWLQLSQAGMDGSRTHRAASRRATDFEDRAGHRAETTPMSLLAPKA